MADLARELPSLAPNYVVQTALVSIGISDGGATLRRLARSDHRRDQGRGMRPIVPDAMVSLDDLETVPQ